MIRSKEMADTANEIHRLYLKVTAKANKFNFDEVETILQKMAEILRQANTRYYANDEPEAGFVMPEKITWLGTHIKSGTTLKNLNTLITELACDCVPVSCQHYERAKTVVPKNLNCETCDLQLMRNDEANFVQARQIWLCDSCGDFFADKLYPTYNAAGKITESTYNAYYCGADGMYELAIENIDQALEWTRMAYLLPGANPQKKAKSTKISKR